MENPRDASATHVRGTEATTQPLEELSDPLDLPEIEAKPLPSGTTLAPEDEEPFTVIRLLKDGFPRDYSNATGRLGLDSHRRGSEIGHKPNRG